MTLYTFPRWSGRFYRPFADWPHALDAAGVRAWRGVLDAVPLTAATIAKPAGSVVDEGFRGARVGWVHPGSATRPLYDQLATLATRANDEAFGFDLVGFAEPLQYTVYEAPSVGYDWHFDMLQVPSELQRKLSLTVQLSDGDEYEGGDLELRDGYNVVKAPRGLGCLVAFPGWALHRVTPVTRGVRRSLVAWIGGPSFR
jgi:PKHD-type hydroxylase